MLYKTCFVLALATFPASAATGDVLLTLNGSPAVVGDYKPADVTALKMDNGVIAITFGGDGSATSLVRNGQELAHNRLLAVWCG